MKRLPRNVLCLLAGAALAPAFSPWNLYPLAILSPAILFYCWRGCRPGAAFAAGWCYGLGAFGAGVGWLHISMHEFGGMGLAASLFATFVLVAYLSLFPALAGAASRRLYGNGPDARFLVGILPALWVLSEWLRGWLLSGFTWLQLGYSQTDSPLAGMAPLAGVLGVGWLVAVLAGLLVLLVLPGHKRRAGALLGMFVAVAAAWGCLRVPWTSDTGRHAGATLIQGAIPQEFKWRDDSRLHSMLVYRDMTEAHWDSAIIVWPETAVPAFPGQVPEYLRRLTREAAVHGADLFIGLPTGDSTGERYFNSLVHLGAPSTAYSKRHLVPFGEYVPFRNILGGLFGFLQIPMSDFSPGPAAEKPVLSGRHGVAGISICYEDTFGEEVIRALPEADYLINVSNDAWFGDSAAPHQHLQMARMRTLETGRYMLRATNSGISAIIDSRGGIVARSRQFVQQAVSGDIRFYSGLTPYARLGNYPVVIAAVLLLLLAAWRSRRVSGAS